MRALCWLYNADNSFAALAWHPQHETLLTSGGSDGSLIQWIVGVQNEVGSVETAHESNIWGLAWHPVGHMLVYAWV